MTYFKCKHIILFGKSIGFSKAKSKINGEGTGDKLEKAKTIGDATMIVHFSCLSQ